MAIGKRVLYNQRIKEKKFDGMVFYLSNILIHINIKMA